MKYFILAGEASGDMHASNLIKALQKKDPEAQFQAWGGDKSEAAGAELLKHYKELAIIGFVEVLKKLPTIFKNFKLATKQVLEFQPDAVILVDFSGFNLRWAKKLRKAGYTGKILYYISPKLWVWNSKRVKKIIAYIDEVYTILPFEVDFYNNHGYTHSKYIGNPLMDEINAFDANPNFIKENDLSEKPIIALLPGSRTGELKNMLPMMLEMTTSFSDYQFVIAGVDWLSDDYEKYLLSNKNVTIVFNDTYNILSNAVAAVVTSGTATLETGLFNVPQLVCYRGNAISYAIAKQVVKVKYISLVNLILDKMALNEYIQRAMNLKNLTSELNALLTDETRRAQLKTDYEELAKRVGQAGASARAAEMIQTTLATLAV